MTHLKRNKIGKFWTIPRKGTKYLAVASHNKNESVPLSVVMRDILKLVRNKKELQRLLNEKQVLINQKEVRETNYPLGLFDVLSLLGSKQNYKVGLSKHKKLIFEEISEKDAEIKIYKILGRKVLAGGKMQLNLNCGKNILSKDKLKIGDSIVLNLKDNKIMKTLSLEKGKVAFVIKGKHTGVQGQIEEIMERGGKTLVKIKSEDEKINVWIKNIIVIK